VTLTTTIRELSVVSSLALDIFYFCFSRSGDMTAGVKIENGSCVHDHASFKSDLSSVN